MIDTSRESEDVLLVSVHHEHLTVCVMPISSHQFVTPHYTQWQACSGHGFKHSAAIGEACAEWAAGMGDNSALSLESFRRGR